LSIQANYIIMKVRSDRQRKIHVLQFYYVSNFQN